MTRLRTCLITLGVLASLGVSPVPASAAMVTISNTYPGDFAGICGGDGTWGFYITNIADAVVAPTEIKAAVAGGGTLTIPLARTNEGMAFYEAQSASKLTGAATAQIDQAWQALKGFFVLGWGPCAATTMAATTQAPLVAYGEKIKFNGRLAGADGKGLADRTTRVRLHSIDADGQGQELGPFKTDAEGRFTVDIKAESHGPIHLTAEYNGSLPIHGAEHGSTDMAVVWSLPEGPVTAQAALVSSAGSAFGVGNRKTTLSGNGFEPNADIGILLYSQPRLVARLTADDTGAFSGEVTLPEGITGAHRLVAAGIDAQHEQIRYLALDVTLAEGGGNGLPVTGAPIWTLSAYAAVLIALGVVIVLRTRRRPRGRQK